EHPRRRAARGDADRPRLRHAHARPGLCSTARRLGGRGGASPPPPSDPPPGPPYAPLTPDLVCARRLDGSAVEGGLAPTSELPIHQLIYGHTDAAAVVHTHSTAATGVSTVVGEAA